MSGWDNADTEHVGEQLPTTTVNTVMESLRCCVREHVCHNQKLGKIFSQIVWVLQLRVNGFDYMIRITLLCVYVSERECVSACMLVNLVSFFLQMYESALPLYKRCSAGSQLNRLPSACIMQRSQDITLVYTCTLVPSCGYKIITFEAFSLHQNGQQVP